jgi:hypothetical protein
MKWNGVGKSKRENDAGQMGIGGEEGEEKHAAERTELLSSCLRSERTD